MKNTSNSDVNAIYEARMRATEDAARIARRDAEDAINEVVRLGNELHELKKDLQLFQKQVGADMNSLERRVGADMNSLYPLRDVSDEEVSTS